MATIGANSGGNLNIFLFELVMVTALPFVPPIVTTVAVHPLLVAPTSIRYTDSSKGRVQETPFTANDEIAGRALRSVQLEGTFGVETRGLGPIIGTGELRFKRFYHEIVRLADAVSQDQVDAEKDLLRSPFLNLALAPYDEEYSYFAVNFYDFWNDRAFACRIPQWSDSRGTFGNASGAVRYQMTVKEAGPLVTGGLGTALITGLFNVLTSWDAVNELLKSYNLESITTSFVNIGDIAASQFGETLTALQDQQKAVQAVLSGAAFGTPLVPVPEDDDEDLVGARSTTDSSTGGSTTRTRPAGVSDYLDNADSVERQALDLAAQVATKQVGTSPDQGRVRWESQADEGGVAGMEQAEVIDNLASLAYAARYQKAAGVFAGMSRAEYQTLIEATGEEARDARIASARRYTVQSTDTASSIERRFGVSWRRILNLNRLLPDEALYPGAELLIPRERRTGLPARIDGLPVFDSHAGPSAWGKDLRLDLATTDEGELLTYEGEEVLRQGSSWIIRVFGSELVRRINDTPEVVREEMLRRQLASLYTSDPRIEGIVSIAASFVDASIELDVVAQAIGGDAVNLGA